MRFTIRDLLWLTVVVSLAVAWWVDRGRLVGEIVDLRNIDSKDYRARWHYPIYGLPNPSAPAPETPKD